MAPIYLSIVIPAFNEETRISKYLIEILIYLKSQKISYEIIVVDDGSIDHTAKIVAAFVPENDCVKLIRIPFNRGKGFAVKTGMLSAKGQFRLFADADGATPITELEVLKKALDMGADIAIASRSLHRNCCVVRAQLHRKVMGAAFNFLVNLLAVRSINDTQCGFKLFTAEAATNVFPLQRIDDFGFDVEVLYISHKKGYRLAEVPVNWTDMKGSKVKLIADSFRMFIDIFKIKLNDFLGYY